MRSLSLAVVIVVLAACASTEPAPVPVVGAAEDLAPLTGEWSGTYESRGTGRSGSITFHLTEDPKGAHGDVLLVPKHEIVIRGELPHEPIPGPNVLAIEFVRVSAGEITGRIAPYEDPEQPDVKLETVFAGHLVGDHIEGTFMTYSDHGVAPLRGTWEVHRHRHTGP